MICNERDGSVLANSFNYFLSIPSAQPKELITYNFLKFIIYIDVCVVRACDILTWFWDTKRIRSDAVSPILFLKKNILHLTLMFQSSVSFQAYIDFRQWPWILPKKYWYFTTKLENSCYMFVYCLTLTSPWWH